MKTAMLAIAMVATATFAGAQESQNGQFDVIETSTSGGQIEIVTRQYGADIPSTFERSLVNCLPMMMGTVDEANQLDDLASGGSANMEEVVRGTLRNEIAVYACGDA